MKSTIQWLDAAKQMHSLSDYALAPKLGVGRGQISRYRNGLDFLSDDAALKLAGLMGMDNAAEIIASAHAERAKSEDARAFWAQLAGMFTKEKAPAPLSAEAFSVGGNGRFRTPRARPAASNLTAIMRSFLALSPARFA